MADLTAIDRRIADTKATLRSLEEDREALIAQNADLHGLAEYLHQVTCHANHTDQCGWGYEYIRDSNPVEPDWGGWTHKRYLARAHKIFVQTGLTKEEIDRALEIYKKIHEVQ